MIIDLFLALLIALQAGTVCQQGVSVGNWTHWLNDHPNAETVGQIQYDDTFELWLIDGAPDVEDGLVLFVFDMDEGRYPHGQCARQL